MSVIEKIRELRHNHFIRFNKFFYYCGNIFRFIIRTIGSPCYISHNIGHYGPYKLDSFFAFSNFKNWGSTHNSGFQTTINFSKNKKCVLDIGAHIGLVSLPLSDVINPQGCIYSFEPSTINSKYLKKHIKLNNITNIKVENYIVGSKDIDSVNFYQSSLPSGKNSVIQELNCSEIKKRQIKIDTYCQQNTIIPDVIKIDVEGYEISVLKGCKQIIKIYKPIIILSVHPAQIKRLGHNLNDLTDLVSSYKYNIKKISNNSTFVDFHEFQLSEYILRPNL
jgi:FkbM family methyltransferase